MKPRKQRLSLVAWLRPAGFWFWHDVPHFSILRSYLLLEGPGFQTRRARWAKVSDFLDGLDVLLLLEDREEPWRQGHEQWACHLTNVLSAQWRRA